MNSITNPMFGISKQEYKDKTDSWLLRLFYKKDKPSFVRTISVGSNPEESLAYIQAVRDEVLEEALSTGGYPGFHSNIHSSKRNKSGINGVQLYYDTTKSPRFCFTAYANVAGKTNSKNAGVMKWGWYEAFLMCIEWRRKMDISTHGYSLISETTDLNISNLLFNCVKAYTPVYPALRGETISY